MDETLFINHEFPKKQISISAYFRAACTPGITKFAGVFFLIWKINKT
jgi:hypothetical protein